jgi:acyl-coenzyme A synthetase/AMP-(fatty) acid ligase
VFFLALAQGATQHVQTVRMVYDIEYMISYIKKNKISVMSMLASRSGEFLRHGGDGLLRALIITGEPSVNIYSAKTAIYNIYAATETASIGTVFKIDRPYPEGTPMGYPVPGADVRLLPDGEIIVGGPIADGYLHEDELTREKFIEYDGKTFFRTADLGSFSSAHENGMFYYHRRKDKMIKIKGHLIMPSDKELYKGDVV